MSNSRVAGDIVGVDFGTSNSSIAYHDAIGQHSECVMNKDGSYNTPSVVYIGKSDTVVGEQAQYMEMIEPNRTVIEVKRKIGQAEPVCTIDGKNYTAKDIGAEVLKSLKEDIYQEMEYKANKAVLTVPVASNEKEREATKEMGRKAGFDVVTLLDEPVAIAYYCDNQGNLTGKAYLIFDLGGGTLDIALVYFGATTIYVLRISGDQKLGGSDFNTALTQAIREKYLKNHTLSVEDEQELRQKVEAAKISLTKKDKVTFSISTNEGRTKPMEVTKEDLVNATKDLMRRMKEHIEAMKGEIENLKKRVSTPEEAAGRDFTDKELAEALENVVVITAGGGSKMPQVQELVASQFAGHTVWNRGDDAVAKGAAAYAYLLSSNNLSHGEVDHSFLSGETKVGKKLERISHYTYGIRLTDPETTKPYVYNMLMRQTALPQVYTKSLVSGAAGNEILLHVFESESEERRDSLDAQKEILTCSLKVDEKKNIPPGTTINVTFTLGEDGILDIAAKEECYKSKVAVRYETGKL